LSALSRFSSLTASSIGRVAYNRLKQSEEGTVHSVFDAAINILVSGGLVSLVPEAIERGPLNMTLWLPAGQSRMRSIGVRGGDKVKVNGSALELGECCLITFDSASIYSPKQKFTASMLSNNEIEANLEVMRKTAALFGNMSGIGELLTLILPSKEKAMACKFNIFATSALPRIIDLEQAFASEESKTLNVAVKELIGLGPGLTPSSDDMLAGLVLLCVLYSKNRDRAQQATRLIAQAITREARGRTTILSEEYLRQASSGRGNEPVTRLCTALLTGSGESVERETRRVLQIGESSGTDITLGIALGAMLCLGQQSSLAQVK
jgi:hypothetical protein